MRKVIPYIASQFRKDKIWLRRTKPSKRQYQICLAIDDSSSMVDNHTKQVRNPRAGLMSNWQQAMLPGHPEVLNMSGRKHFENTNYLSENLVPCLRRPKIFKRSQKGGFRMSQIIWSLTVGGLLSCVVFNLAVFLSSSRRIILTMFIFHKMQCTIKLFFMTLHNIISEYHF